MLGVSGDNLETHQSFADKHGISFPLFDDNDGAIRKLYGHDRSTYLIDQQGIVRLVTRGIPDNKQFLNALDNLNQ